MVILVENVRRMVLRIALAAAALLGGCAGQSPAAQSESEGESTTTDPGRGDDTSSSDTGTGEPPASACVAGTDVSAAPQTIAEAVALINALPHPVTLDCFLERLERPIPVALTSSVVSLQPAAGARSPRVFMFYGELIMSVATDGTPGNTLLEFGEMVSPTESVKGEIPFPVTEVLAANAPVEHIFTPEGSTCRQCHGFEAPHPAYEHALASEALQFRPVDSVDLEALFDEHAACVPSEEPERCARLAAILGHGAVVESPFPYDLPTIFE